MDIRTLFPVVLFLYLFFFLTWPSHEIHLTTNLFWPSFNIRSFIHSFVHPSFAHQVTLSLAHPQRITFLLMTDFCVYSVSLASLRKKAYFVICLMAARFRIAISNKSFQTDLNTTFESKRWYSALKKSKIWSAFRFFVCTLFQVVILFLFIFFLLCRLLFLFLHSRMKANRTKRIAKLIRKLFKWGDSSQKVAKIDIDKKRRECVFTLRTQN